VASPRDRVPSRHEPVQPAGREESRRTYSKVELDQLWHHANDALKDLLLGVGGFALDERGSDAGLGLWLENFNHLAPAEAFLYNLMTLPLGVCAPDIANLPKVAAWAWDTDAFRDLLEICISGLVANAESWQKRLQILDDVTRA
jgi:hypothetical protein